MPDFITSEKLGMRPIASGSRQVQGYRAGIVEDAEFQAASALKSSGQAVEQFGANIVIEEEKKRKKAELINDSLIEAQLKSKALQLQLAKEQEYQERQDYDKFEDDIAKSYDSLAPMLQGVSPENRPLVEISLADMKAQALARTNELVRGRRTDSRIAAYETNAEENKRVLLHTGNLAAYEASLQELSSLAASGDIDNRQYVQFRKFLDSDMAEAQFESMPIGQKIEALRAATTIGGSAGNDIYKDIKGLLESGNINIYNRPMVKNKDGSISTVRSVSFQDEDGKEVLIPTVSDDGKIMSDEEAIDTYYRTGKHLGKFSNTKDADYFAENILHKQQQRFYLNSGVSKEKAIEFVLNDLEGGAQVVTDSNGYPAMYGINAEFNPDLAEKIRSGTLTKEEAVQRAKEVYWDKNNIDQYPPALQAIAFDMHFNGFDDVKGAVEQSGGDPNKLMEIRQEYYNSLAKNNPKKHAKNLPGWENRLKKLSGFMRGKSGTLIDRLPFDEVLKKKRVLGALLKPEVDAKINDMVAELSSNGTSSIQINQDEVEFAYGSDAPRVIEEIESAREYGLAVNAVKGMNIEQEIAFLNGNAPEGEEFVNEQRKYAAIGQAITEKRKQLAEDPVSYVDNSFNDIKSLRESYEIANSELGNSVEEYAIKQQKLNDYITANVEMQKQIGVPDGERMVMSPSVAKQYVDSFENMDANQIVQSLSSMQSLYNIDDGYGGTHWDDVKAELQKAGMSPSLSVIMDMDGVGQAKARQDLAIALKSGKELSDAIDPSMKTKIKASVFGALGEYYSSTAGLYESSGEDVSRYSNAVEALTMQYIYSNKYSDEVSAAKAAAKDIILGQYSFDRTVNTLRVPKEYDSNKIFSQVPYLISSIVDIEDVAPITYGSLGGVSENIQRDEYRSIVSRVGMPFLNKKGDGFYIKDHIGDDVSRIVEYEEDGVIKKKIVPLEFKFDDILKSDYAPVYVRPMDR